MLKTEVRLRRRDHMRMRRPRETGDSSVDPQEKNLWRKLWVIKELPRERQRRSVHCFSRRETRVIFRS